MLKEIKKIAQKLSMPIIFQNFEIGKVPGAVNLKEKQFCELDINQISYNSQEFEAKIVTEIPALKKINTSGKVDWLIVNGFGDKHFLKEVENNLVLHKLTIEDILSPKHPPKLEVNDGALFIVLRLVFPGDDGQLDTSISMMLSDNALVLFSPFSKFDFSENIIKRLTSKSGVIRDRGADYLLFALTDIVIDSYFPKVEMISNSIKEIDQSLFEDENASLLQDIKVIRQVLNIYFDNLYPLKDILSRLSSGEYDAIAEENYKYYKNCLDHVTYLCERINRLKESTSDIMNLKISMNGQKMNEIMKVLTMMSSIFIPLSFICGLYGMNFDTSKSALNMPELSWQYGYPFVIGLMLTLVFGMMIYFYKKKWL